MSLVYVLIKSHNWDLYNTRIIQDTFKKVYYTQGYTRRRIASSGKSQVVHDEDTRPNQNHSPSSKNLIIEHDAAKSTLFQHGAG